MTMLEAQTQVNCGLFLLKKYLEELNKPISPIYTAIDDACGRDRTKEIRDSAIEVLESIIEAKTFLGYDCDREKEMVTQIKEAGGENEVSRK